MSKSQQLLVLDPPIELKFKGPFTEVVTSELKISNPSWKRICFKVKTTAPKQYCVRPNNGLIEPGTSVNVAVMLQPFHYDPNEKNRHKFLVQSLVVPDSVSENLENLWKDTPVDQLMESKLKCVFDVDAELLQMKSDVAEVKGSDQIKRELMQLREENAKLKDEGLRLRRGIARADVQSSMTDHNSATAVASGQTNLVWITAVVILALFALILGLVIGKFVL
jgi:vesicle-associated membrane protein-associated protein A